MMEDKLQRLLNQFHFAPVRDTHKGVLEGKGYSPRQIHIPAAKKQWRRWRDERRNEGITASNSFDFTGAADPSRHPSLVGKTQSPHLRQLLCGSLSGTSICIPTICASCRCAAFANN